jgi:hypothetical protein
MRCRRLDSNHDFCFGRGFGDYLEDQVSSPDAIAQAIKTRLLLFLGEWWKDLRDGLPLWQKILGSRVKNKAILDKILIDRIQGLKLPDNRYAITAVKEITSEFDSETREYSFSCRVDTVFGELYVTNKDQLIS